MEKNKFEEFEGIYCQDDQHYHRREIIQYLMIKQDKGTITRRLFCNKCYLGKYSSYQEYCCNIQELIRGNILEAFKYTKFDSDSKQMFFNYLKNLQPNINEDLIHNMIELLKAEFESALEDLKVSLLENVFRYQAQIIAQNFQPLVQNHFNCDQLREALLNKNFERSPQQFHNLNKLAEEYVEKINNGNIDERLKQKTEESIKNQKNFFNMDRYQNGLSQVLQEIKLMQERIFSEYKFSQSSLSTPYIDNVIKRISPDQAETVHKNSKRVFRLTEQGFNYQVLQQVQEFQRLNTLTIIQTQNKQIFGVYNCITQKEKSFLFHMNKEQIFQIKKDKKPCELNLQADLSTWLIKFGEGDITINASYKSCSSALGTGFDISGSSIFDTVEYLSDSQKFDITDMEIFVIPSNDQPPPQPQQKPAGLLTQQGQIPFQPGVRTTNISGNQPGQPPIIFK